MTPLEVYCELRGLGFRLGLRPGGLRLKGEAEPTPEVLALIQAHRADLVAFLEADAVACEVAEESYQAGRITPFLEDQGAQKGLNRGWNR